MGISDLLIFLHERQAINTEIKPYPRALTCKKPFTTLFSNIFKVLSNKLPEYSNTLTKKFLTLNQLIKWGGCHKTRRFRISNFFL